MGIGNLIRRLSAWVRRTFGGMGPAAIFTLVALILTTLTLLFNTWVSTLNSVNQTLERENSILRERASGLLTERIWYVDTLQIREKSFGYLFYECLRLYGGRIEFCPQEKEADYPSDIIQIAAENRIDGFPHYDSVPIFRDDLNMQFEKDRFDFTIEGRRFYLTWIRIAAESPDAAAVIGTVTALEPLRVHLDASRTRDLLGHTN